MLETIKHFFKVLFTPSCWLMNPPYDKDADEWLMSALESPKFTWIGSEYRIKLNGKEFWTQNFPYAYGYEKNRWGGNGNMPSRRAVFKLKEAVDKFKREHVIKDEHGV